MVLNNLLPATQFCISELTMGDGSLSFAPHSRSGCITLTRCWPTDSPPEPTADSYPSSLVGWSASSISCLGLVEPLRHSVLGNRSSLLASQVSSCTGLPYFSGTLKQDLPSLKSVELLKAKRRSRWKQQVSLETGLKEEKRQAYFESPYDVVDRRRPASLRPLTI